MLRINGSHPVVGHADGHRAVVPVHHGKDIERGLLRKIIEDAALTVDECERLLRNRPKP
jgi:predicted RNA binding protein YcfA (HicA-like mRNA interferase family)